MSYRRSRRRALVPTVTPNALVVYEHVAAQLAQGPVGSSNRSSYGPADIAAALGLPEPEVKRHLKVLTACGHLTLREGSGSGGKDRIPESYVVAKEAAPPPPPEAAGELPTTLAQCLGVIADGLDPEPATPLDWALYWVKRGLHVFPVERFLGSPLIARWHHEATTNTATIAEWWTTWPDADIAAVPGKSGRFAIVASAEQDGDAALRKLERDFDELPADFRFRNRWGDEHLLMRGHAVTSHHQVGPGLHVLGVGHFVFLPDSWAPIHDWRR